MRSRSLFSWQIAAWLAALVVVLVGVIGCGGGGSSTGPATISGLGYSVSWPERSRADITGPASALSARFTLVGAAADGSDVISNVNRETTTPDAYTGSYTFTTPVRTSATVMQATFFSATEQQGQVVGTATATFTITGGTVSPINFTLDGKVATVQVVDPGTLGAGDPATQLQFTAQDSNQQTLALSPGSASWTMQAAAGATITKDGQFSATNAGAYQVQVTVDGVASALTTINVANIGGGNLENGTFTIGWPARSRDSVPGLAAALSARVTFVNGNPAGGDVSVVVERDAANSAAYNQSYPVGQPILRTTASFHVAFYRGAAASGEVVGYATGSVDGTGANLNLFGVQTVSALHSIAVVNPGTLTTGTSQQQLLVTAKNDSNESVALTAGSIFWILVSGPTTGALTPDGLFTPAVSGDYVVTAAVDGVTSAPLTISVVPNNTEEYKLFVAPNYNGNMQVRFALMNSLGQMVTAQTDATNSAVTTWSIGGSLTLIDQTMSARGLSDTGIILEAREVGGNTIVGTIEEGGTFTPLPTGGTEATTATDRAGTRIYPDGSIITGGGVNQPALYFANRSAQPVAIPGSSVAEIGAAVPVLNASHELIGGTKYWSAPAVTPQALPAPTGATEYRATGIADNGAIVGTFATQGTTHTRVAKWSSAGSAPADLGTVPSANAQYLVSASINSSGTIVGTYHGPNPQQTGGFIHTSAQGMRLIETVVDTAAQSVQIYELFQVLNNGWIGGFGVQGGYKKGIILRPR